MKKLLVLTLLAGAFLFAGCGSDKSTQVPMPTDDAPPLAPAGLTARVDNSLTAVLIWTPNTEPDLAGYRVYIYDPSPRRDGSYVLQNPEELLTEERWTSPSIQYNQVLWVRLTAVDAGGNESASVQHRLTLETTPTTPTTPTPEPGSRGGGEEATDASGTGGNR